MQAIAHLLKTGELKPFIDKSFTLDQIRESQVELEKGHTKGKIVITME